MKKLLKALTMERRYAALRLALLAPVTPEKREPVTEVKKTRPARPVATAIATA